MKFVKNLGNYQSLALEASTTVVIDEGETVESVFESAWSTVKKEIGTQLKNHEEATK